MTGQPSSWARALAFGAGLAAALVIPAVAAAAPPPTLTGEQIQSSGGPPVVFCQQGGDFSFTTSGVATGPYPGIFTETGTGTVSDPTPGSVSTFTAFSASFTIEPSTGSGVLVSGTQTGSGGSVCQDTMGDTGGRLQTRYRATISTPGGNYSDHGSSDVRLLFTGPSSGTGLVDSFSSALTQPVLIAPTSKNQCTNGGWQNFGGLFKNEGDCVSFVASGGKNPPGGS